MHNLEKAMVTRIVESDGVQKESEIEFRGNEPSRRYVMRSIQNDKLNCSLPKLSNNFKAIDALDKVFEGRRWRPNFAIIKIVVKFYFYM